MTPRRVAVHPVDQDNQVVSVQYRRQPCGNCPWRLDAPPGEFPTERYVSLAETAYDLGQKVFACHKSSDRRPGACAGFLVRGAEHNLTVRLWTADGRIDPSQVSDGGHDLHESYRAMAVANGVPGDHPALRECRP